MSIFSRSRERRARADEGERSGGGEAPLATGTVVVGTTDSLTLRSAPGMSGQSVAALPDGERVQLLGTQGNWFHVRTGQGEGWVFSKYIALRAVPVEGAGEQRQSSQRQSTQTPEPTPEPAPEAPKRKGFLSRLFGRDDKDASPGGASDDKAGQHDRAPQGLPKELRRLLSRSDLSAQQVQQARAMIEELPADQKAGAFQALQAATPYLNQLNNDEMGPRHTSDKEMRNLGPISCNLTALSMCLQVLGVPNPDPSTTYPLALEHIRQKHFPKMDRKEYNTWARISQKLGANVIHIHQGDAKLRRQFWLGAPKKALQSGQGVLVSIIGHIVRVQEITEHGIIVDDTYGASKLLPGMSSNNYQFQDYDGNDNLWPWADVEAHGFRYVGKVVK